MVTSLWNKIEMYCGAHQEKLLMHLEQRRGVVFYQCPEAAAAYAERKAPTCKNDLPLKEFEKMLEYLEGILYEAELNNEIPNLQNLKFTINRFQYTVFEHNDLIKVAVKNLRYYV